MLAKDVTGRRQLCLIFLAVGLVLLSVLTGSILAQTAGTWVDNPVLFPAGGRAEHAAVVYDANAFANNVGDDIDPLVPGTETYAVRPYYKMWMDGWGAGSGFRFAYSDDGVNWTQSSHLGLPGLTNPLHSYVIYDPGGFGGGAATYKIWHWNYSFLYGPCNTVAGTGCSIWYAESTDGINWTNNQPVFGGVGGVATDPTWWQRGSYGPVTVIYNPPASNAFPVNQPYVMYYDGTTGGLEDIGLAYSADGITWTRFTDAGTPIFPNGPSGAWDDTHVPSGTVLQTPDGSWELWYSGGTGVPWQGVGYATSPDGLNWTRASANPLFELGNGVDSGLGAPGSWNEGVNWMPMVIYSATAFDGNGPACYYKMWRTGTVSYADGNEAIAHSCADQILSIVPTPVPPPPPARVLYFDPAISKLGFLAPGETGLEGEQLEWVVTVSNQGNGPGYSLVVTDTLWEELRVDNVVLQDGTSTINGRTVTVTIPVLNPGQSTQFSIFTTVLVGGAVDNTACVRADNLQGERCATALAVSALPATGETLRWRELAVMGIRFGPSIVERVVR